MNEPRKVVVKDSPELAEKTGADSVLILSEEEVVDEAIQDVAADEEAPLGVEDLPDDELIWPGGPTAGQIKLWKQEWQS